MAETTAARIESELDVKSYIQNLRFALTHGAKINFQEKRLVDENRPEKYTNQYTVRTLFPDENPVDALKRELLSLSSENYMRTVKDLRFPKKVKCVNLAKYIIAMMMYILKYELNFWEYTVKPQPL